MESLDKEQIINLVDTFGYDGALEFCVFNYFAQRDSDDPDSKEVYNAIMMTDFYKKYFGVMTLGMFRKQYVDKSVNGFYTDIDKIELIDIASDSYDIIIKKFNELAKELNISDSLNLSTLFSYMLYTGSFSVTGCHNYKIEDRLVLSGHYAFDVFNGIGVCLNYSDMLTDILINAGYNASTIINKMNNSIKFDYIPELERGIFNPKFLSRFGDFVLRPISNKFGNHACTLIQDNSKKFYIYDPTNLAMFDCLNNKEAVCKIGTGVIKLKPYLSTFFTLKDVNYDTIKNLCLAGKIESPYSRKDFIYAWEEGIENFKENKSLIDDYHDDIYNDIKIIADNSKLLSKSRRKIFKRN